MVDLARNGFEVISVDDLSYGSMRMLQGVEKVLGHTVKNYRVNLCNLEDTEAIFIENPDIAGIVHFAAYKSVPESVHDPLKYFHNNINSLLNLLRCAEEYGVRHFVFSSSCSVYGNTSTLPVDENAPLLEPESPYARTKQMGEAICRDFTRAYPDFNITLLRYFNPVGAHPSGHIGELQLKPENLVPVITQTAIGKRPVMQVFGNDYPTRDGSCLRDYIHVMDIAHAHTLALQFMLEERNAQPCDVFNLGSGEGVTVLELIRSFEKVSGMKLPYERGPRRAGDVVAVYADNSKARRLLGWEPQYSLDQMMETAWRWEQNIKRESEQVHLN